MKKLATVAILLCIGIGGYTQQEAQFTQFMYNKLTLNPAYAGSAEMPCISCIHRSQWMGLEGAPTSQALNFHSPVFGKRIGLGGSVAHDKIGPTNSYLFSLMYAYRMQIGKGKLSMGMRGALKSYQVDFTDLRTTHSGDGKLPEASTSKVFPNFGIGLYYETEKLYAGFSIPNILNDDLAYFAQVNNTDYGRSLRHFYFMTGYLFKVSETVDFKPSALVKYVSNAPLDLDLNMTVIFLDKFWTGLSYRMGGDLVDGVGESIDLLIQYQISPGLRAGISYDFTLSDIQDYQSGTIELQMHYCILPKNERLTNPRFF